MEKRTLGSLISKTREESVLRQNLILLASAKFISGFAAYIYDVGIVIYLFEQTGSVAVIGGFFVSQLLPAFVILLTGSVIDRYIKKNLIVLSHFMKAAAFIILLFDRSVFSIYFVTFIINLLLEFESSTFNALMTSVFQKKHLIKAASVINLSDSVSMTAAPLCASLIAMHFSIFSNLFIDIILFVGSAIIYMFLKINFIPYIDSEESINKKIGYWGMLKNKNLLKTVIFWNIFMLCIGITTPLEISMIEGTLGMPSAYYGIGNSIEGVGMLVASGVILWMTKKLSSDRMIMIGLFSAACSYLMIGTAGNIGFYFMGACLVGMTAGLCPMGFKTELQIKSDTAIIGRVFTTTRFTVLLSRVGGSLIAGELLKTWNIRVIYYFVAGGLILAAKAYRRKLTGTESRK